MALSTTYTKWGWWTLPFHLSPDTGPVHLVPFNISCVRRLRILSLLETFDLSEMHARKSHNCFGAHIVPHIVIDVEHGYPQLSTEHELHGEERKER